jgi:homocysteine S-methyltransferase
MYPASPAYFADYAHAFRSLGVSLIGGCCGTTSAHIGAMCQALKQKGVEIEASQITISSVETSEGITTAGHPSQLAEKLSQGRFVVAVEMHPPRGLSTHKLIAAAGVLAEAGADVINVADTPMARMRMSAWAVCNLIQQEVHIETTLHFPTRGRNLLRLQGDLLAAYALGIRNIFVIMGDPTRIGDYPHATDAYDLLPSGVIKLIKHQFNMGFDHAGLEIGQPTSFFVGCALNLNAPDRKREIQNLHRKISAGADFIITQPIFEPQNLQSFLQHYGEIYGELDVPLLVGVIPLFGFRHALYLHNEVPGVAIPDEIFSRIKQEDDSPQEGVEIAKELIEQIKPWVGGIYLIPAFNRFDLTAEVIEAVKKQSD